MRSQETVEFTRRTLTCLNEIIGIMRRNSNELVQHDEMAIRRYLEPMPGMKGLLVWGAWMSNGTVNFRIEPQLSVGQMPGQMREPLDALGVAIRLHYGIGAAVRDGMTFLQQPWLSAGLPLRPARPQASNEFAQQVLDQLGILHDMYWPPLEYGQPVLSVKAELHGADHLMPSILQMWPLGRSSKYVLRVSHETLTGCFGEIVSLLPNYCGPIESLEHTGNTLKWRTIPS